MRSRETALITGIGGFVGMVLAKHLLKQGVEVQGTVFTEGDKRNVRVLIDDPECPVSEDGIRECDLREPRAVDRLLSETTPDQIYHLAAVTFIPASFEDPRMTFETNLFGTLNLFSALARSGHPARILSVSSADIYGLVGEENLPIKESCSLRPLNPYAVSKASADLLGFQYAKSHGLQIVRARPFNHTGPGRPDHFVCSDFTKQVAEIEAGKREPVLFTGDLSARRDFSDVRDIVDAYTRILREGEPGEAYNICSGKAYSVKEILTMILEASDTTVEVRRDEKRLRPSDTPVTVGDNTKLKEATGWSPKIPLERTVSDMLSYWRESVQTGAALNSK